MCRFDFCRYDLQCYVTPREVQNARPERVHNGIIISACNTLILCGINKYDPKQIM